MIHRRKDLDEDISVPDVHNRMTQAGTRVREKIRGSNVDTCVCGQGSLRKKKSSQQQVSQGQQNYLRFGFSYCKHNGTSHVKTVS